MSGDNEHDEEWARQQLLVVGSLVICGKYLLPFLRARIGPFKHLLFSGIQSEEDVAAQLQIMLERWSTLQADSDIRLYHSAKQLRHLRNRWAHLELRDDDPRRAVELTKAILEEIGAGHALGEIDEWVDRASSSTTATDALINAGDTDLENLTVRLTAGEEERTALEARQREAAEKLEATLTRIELLESSVGARDSKTAERDRAIAQALEKQRRESTADLERLRDRLAKAESERVETLARHQESVEQLERQVSQILGRSDQDDGRRVGLVGSHPNFPPPPITPSSPGSTDASGLPSGVGTPSSTDDNSSFHDDEYDASTSPPTRATKRRIATISAAVLALLAVGGLAHGQWSSSAERLTDDRETSSALDVRTTVVSNTQTEISDPTLPRPSTTTTEATQRLSTTTAPAPVTTVAVVPAAPPPTSPTVEPPETAPAVTAPATTGPPATTTSVPATTTTTTTTIPRITLGWRPLRPYLELDTRVADIDDAVETVPDRRARTVHIDNYRMENGRQLCGPWPSARAAGGATSREWLGGGEDNPWISVRLWWFQFQSDASAHFDNHVDLMSSCQVWNELPTFERLDLLFEDGSTSITFRVFGRPDLTSSYSVIRDANVVMLVHLADGTTERVGSYLPLANDLFREVVADVAGDFPAFD